MKFAMSMKSPDSIHYLMKDAKVEIEFSECDDKDEEINKLQKLIDKFVKYQEYIIIEFDTETGTCIVALNSKQ